MIKAHLRRVDSCGAAHIQSLRAHGAVHTEEKAMAGRSFARSLFSAALVLGTVASAWAAPQVFYADRLTAQTPQSTRDLFLLGSTNLQLEDFEAAPRGIPQGTLNLFAGQGSLSQSAFAGGEILQGPAQNGRFNTTPNCDPLVACKWWETADSFEIALGAQKSAFGFYATDLGDAGGAISLDFWNDNTRVRSGIAVTQPTQTSGLLFFGYIDDTFTFNRVTFNVTQTNVNPSRFDFIGFDDVLAGVRASNPPGPGPNPVSAPGTIALVTLSLGLLAATRVRRKSAAAPR